MRWDLLALPIVAVVLGIIVIKYAKPQSRLPIYIFWAICLVFVIYWIITGEIW